MDAAPVAQWTYEAWWLMISNGVMGLLWIVNTMSGNDGNLYNMIWLRASQWSHVFPLITLGLAVTAALSYGTQADVMMSWSGSPAYKEVKDADF